jgi:hypothetical protein
MTLFSFVWLSAFVLWFSYVFDFLTSERGVRRERASAELRPSH